MVVVAAAAVALVVVVVVAGGAGGVSPPHLGRSGCRASRRLSRVTKTMTKTDG